MVLSNFTNQSAIARLAAGIFFPQRPALGLDQRSYSPAVLDKIVSANAEHKSAYKAQKMLWKLGEVSISVSEIMDLSGMIGQELCEHLQQQSLAHAEQRLEPQHPQPPRVAVVSVDGGRIMTREEGERGVHEQHWKETKNACLLTMSSTPSDTDPHPELPACFTNREYVEKLVREMHSSGYCGGKSEEIPAISPKTAAPSSTTVEPSNSSANSRRQEKPWRPKRLMRTCISSMACSDDFGPVVAGEAQQRGFYTQRGHFLRVCTNRILTRSVSEVRVYAPRYVAAKKRRLCPCRVYQAEQKGFVGDGGTWNWTIHAAYFSDFVPITDFVHPLGYLYDVAQVLSPQDPWPQYLRATTACWQGRVAEVLGELRAWAATHLTLANEKLSEDDPRSTVRETITYLENNEGRMDYPSYRRRGLPVSSFMIESLIKEINYRVKGTEKFWNRPQGAEQILQIRAAALCDDDRLSQWILNRRGSYFYRRSTPQKTALAVPA